MPDLSPLRLRTWLAALLLTLLLPMPGHAVGVDDLLPVDQAFVLSASTTDGGIEVRWKIADGYYLYRHRTSVQADAGFAAGALRLPKGKAYKDEFFGDVETYRGELVATLPGEPAATRTVLTVKYQGCADAGICYPPQTRRLTVALPAAASATGGATTLRDPFARGPAGPGGPGLLGATGNVPLPAEQAFGFEAIAGDGNTLLLRFLPAPGYYLYRDRTQLSLDPAARSAGLQLGAPRWPPSRSHRDEHFGQVQVYFDPVDVPVPVIRRSGAATSLQLTATFQGCQNDGICYPPMRRTIAVDLPAGTVAAAAVPGAPTAAAPLATPSAAAAPPVATGAVDVPRAARVAAVRASPPAERASTATGALSALLLALLGGLVLNLMPCVLPVLSLKALSLAESGTPGAARRHAVGYTAGVILSFLALGAAALGLRHTGHVLGWGFQLQQPLVVALLALVMFALGLSLSGLWHVGGRWIGAGHSLTQRNGVAGDFFTGVLAVVVATPCTAPFMGAALAWAFLAPAPLALAVFAMLGLGLALPFVLIGLVPGLAMRLPRPGAWMDTLKQALAFPLYLTAAWLLWVLGRQRGPDAIAWTLAGAVAIAFAAWAWTRSRHGAPRWGAAALAAGLVGAGTSLTVVARIPRAETAAPASVAQGRVPFSQARLDALRAAGRVVFVNVTADWCVSCKANEKTVLGRPAFEQAMREAGAVYMLGDWTDTNPALTAFLQVHGAVGVPLYVVYGRDGRARVLPTILTPATVREALREAAR